LGAGASEVLQEVDMLEGIAWVSIGLALASAVVIGVDEIRHPQRMGVMNVVWPATALYLSVAAVWWYFRAGRRMAKDAPQMMMGGDEGRAPNFEQSALATSHCGAGCAVADVVTEFAVFGMGLTVAGSALLASFVWDFCAAWALGVVFQYFTIKPMRKLATGAGVVAAMKADTLSIVAFQVGMYGWMALVHFVLFPGPHLEPNGPAFWLMMQVGMVCGFVTSLPMNRWLVVWGWKERMG
jgi:Domain of unknown function (DUF4396)